MRRSLTRKRLRDLRSELARCAPRRGTYRVYLLGGGTAVLQGWRPSTIDADLYADKDETTISKASRSACNSTSS